MSMAAATVIASSLRHCPLFLIRLSSSSSSSSSSSPPPPPPPPPSSLSFSRRTAAASIASVATGLARFWSPPLEALAEEETASTKAVPPPPRRPAGLAGIENTRSWFQFSGDGFSIRVPPGFEDVMEPEDYNTGLTLYGDKVKPKTFAARFASPDGYVIISSFPVPCRAKFRSEVVSVVIRQSNQLKITFLEAKDITDLGSLKEAAKLFVPGGANLYSARTIKIKEDEESFRTYYFYEFGINDQHVALTVAVNSGKAYIAGAAAPHVKWDEDGVKLRSASISLSLG